MSSNRMSYALAGVLAVSLVGCGSSSDGGDPAPTPTPNPTPGDSVCDESFVECSGSDAVLSGTIDKSIELDGAYNWFLDGFVFVGAGANEVTSEAQASSLKANRVTLTVPAGTEVKGIDGDAALIVTRGGRLMAQGTAAAPITFSSLDADYDGLGEWGGVVLQGWGEFYGEGGEPVCHNGTQSYCNVPGEGDAGFFGGDDNADDSGVLTYVRIAEGGRIASANSEINGLTLQGVGHGTTLSHIQVHNNLDDGVEWFGGAVNARYLVLTGNDDDDIDFDTGWKGNVQYALIIKSNNAAPAGSNDPRAIEANSSDEAYHPQTEGALANITIRGGAAANAAGEPGMRLRGAVRVTLYNSAVANYTDECVRIDDANTDGAGNIVFSDVTLVNVIGAGCVGTFYDHEVADAEVGEVGERSFGYDELFAINNAALATVTPPSMTAVDNGSGFAFDATGYIGAVAPGTSNGNAWWQGWVIPGSTNQ